MRSSDAQNHVVASADAPNDRAAEGGEVTASCLLRLLSAQQTGSADAMR